MTRAVKYCLYREDPDYVAQCLNVDVSSFGSTKEEAIANLKEALELYFEDGDHPEFNEITDAVLGEELISA